MWPIPVLHLSKEAKKAEVGAKAMGHPPSGILGYAHILGGYLGGQADICVWLCQRRSN